MNNFESLSPRAPSGSAMKQIQEDVQVAIENHQNAGTDGRRLNRQMTSQELTALKREIYAQHGYQYPQASTDTQDPAAYVSQLDKKQAAEDRKTQEENERVSRSAR